MVLNFAWLTFHNEDLSPEEGIGIEVEGALVTPDVPMDVIVPRVLEEEWWEVGAATVIAAAVSLAVCHLGEKEGSWQQDYQGGSRVTLQHLCTFGDGLISEQQYFLQV